MPDWKGIVGTSPAEPRIPASGLHPGYPKSGKMGTFVPDGHRHKLGKRRATLTLLPDLLAGA